jgi:hypothetical protein
MFHFIDTNVPMYAVGADHPLKRPCLAILEAVATGALTAVTDVEVLQEILHRYTALGQRTRAAEVARLFLQVVPEALPITKETFVLAWICTCAIHPSRRAIVCTLPLCNSIASNALSPPIATSTTFLGSRASILRTGRHEHPAQSSNNIP